MMPVRDPSTVIGCAVTNDWAFRCSTRLVEQEGGHIVAAQTAEVANRAAPSYAALIYDLAPWDERALARIDHLRSLRPELPLLLYLPPVSPAVSLVPSCGRLTNVRLRMQERHGDGVKGLQQDVRWLLRSVPVREIMTQVADALPEVSSLTTLFSHHVLRRLSVKRRATVTSAARALGLSKRTLERRMRNDRLPPPKEIIDWLTILHVSLIAARSSLSVSRVARSIQMNPNDLYRIKKRLADRTPRGRLACSSDLYSTTLAAFAGRCRALRERPRRRALVSI